MLTAKSDNLTIDRVNMRAFLVDHGGYSHAICRSSCLVKDCVFCEHHFPACSNTKCRVIHSRTAATYNSATE